MPNQKARNNTVEKTNHVTVQADLGDHTRWWNGSNLLPPKKRMQAAATGAMIHKE
jgi:hypothetical protein